MLTLRCSKFGGLQSESQSRNFITRHWYVWTWILFDTSSDDNINFNCQNRECSVNLSRRSSRLSTKLMVLGFDFVESAFRKGIQRLISLKFRLEIRTNRNKRIRAIWKPELSSRLVRSVCGTLGTFSIFGRFNCCIQSQFQEEFWLKELSSEWSTLWPSQKAPDDLLK